MTCNAIKFFVSGLPKGQPRPKAFARRFGDKWMARVYESGTAENWKSQIAASAQPHKPPSPLTEPLHVDLVFYFPRPKSHFRTGKRCAELREDAPRHHVSKPDRDNADKAVLDALTTLGFWRDDAQICDGRIQKLYADNGNVGCQIEICLIPDAAMPGE